VAADRTDLSISAPVAPLSGGIRTTIPRSVNFVPLTHSYTQVSRLVKEQGLLGRSRWFYALLGGGLLLALGGAIAGFVLLGESWFQLLIAGALGIIFTQFAFFAHEAAHRQVLASGPSNDRLGRLLATAMVGMSYAWWMTKHTRHHANPNQLGKDPDIARDTISFVEEDAVRARGPLALLTRWQAALFFPLLLLEGVNLHFTSIRALLTRGRVDGRWLEIGVIAARFGLYLTAVFWFLPLGMAFAFLSVQLAVFGLYMGASFAPNHMGMPIIPEGTRLDFFSKQVRTSRNIKGGWWMTALMGGLNHQVEHHLFPSMARPQLARARAIVREHCRELDVPYSETSLPRAYVAVLRSLDRVGRAVPDPFVCPMVARYRRA